MADEQSKQTKKIFCNTCNGPRNHFLQATHEASDQDSALEGPPDDQSIFETWTDALWICAGCSTATLEHTSNFGGLPEDEQIAPDITYYPKRSASSATPRSFIKLKPKLRALYREIITAFNENCLLLCTVGLRTLIEAVCDDKEIRGLKLEHQIDGLVRFLPSQNLIDYLHGFRFTGNDAAHKLEALTRQEAQDAIRVMEDLLNFLYDFDYRASRIKNASKRASLRGVGKRGSVQ